MAVASRALSLAETSPFHRATTLGDGERFGPYTVHEQLGAGGMAYVHRAVHGVGKQVALKRLLTDSSEDPELVAAFVHEAQLAARIHHPNIAQAYDLGKVDGTFYIAMELVPGPTLAQVIACARDGAGAVPLAIALHLLIQICDALDYAHELCDDGGHRLELIHRDVSPMNIIISRTGAAKLIDFGIAKVKSTRRSTEAGIIKGKQAYMAPEYTLGQLDQRADLFGLGVVAHELLTGRRLFAGDTDLETLRNLRAMPVPPPSRFRAGISPELDRIVLTALEREPGLRWQTAAAMRGALVDEARRLGAGVSGRQIRDWVEWTFAQVPRRPSSVDRLLENLEPSISISIEVEEPVIEAAKAVVVVDKPPKAAAHRAPAWRAPTRWMRPQPRRSASPVILLALLAFAALAVDQGWIDVPRWHDLLAAYLG